MTKYSAYTKQLALKAYKAACTDIEVAGIVGVTRDTLHRWRKRYPDFNDAVTLAKLPPDSPEALTQAEQRREQAEQMLDDYLRTGLAKRVVVEGDGMGSYTRTEFNLLPDRYLIERILGPAEVQVQPFELTISIAEPEPDDDDDDLEED
ncbi:MAG: hypothetical protein AAFV85_26730 [Cyanobacteria bacterium J06634_6]